MNLTFESGSKTILDVVPSVTVDQLVVASRHFYALTSPTLNVLFRNSVRKLENRTVPNF